MLCLNEQAKLLVLGMREFSCSWVGMGDFSLVGKGEFSWAAWESFPGMVREFPLGGMGEFSLDGMGEFSWGGRTEFPIMVG